MQTFVSFRTSKRDIGPERLARLLELHPGGKDGHSLFHLSLPEDDPITKSVLNEFGALGLTPCPDKGRKPDYSREVWLRRFRVFSEQEIAEADFLIMQPKSRIELTGRTAQGLITIPKYKLEGITRIGRTQSLTTWIILVSYTTRRALEKAGLSHMVFRPTQLLDFVERGSQELRPIPWDDHGEPWHQLQSDVSMPPVSAPTYTIYGNGQRVPPDSPTATFFKEDGYNDAVLYYEKASVHNLGPFDIALTHERLGGEDYRLPIVSQRFRECVMKLGLECTWRPIVFK